MDVGGEAPGVTVMVAYSVQFPFVTEMAVVPADTAVTTPE
jgi:hypothetical protein